MFEITGSRFSDQVFNALDKAAKIAIALYVFPLTIMALLQVLASGIIISYAYLPIGILFFVIHLKVVKEKYYFSLLGMYDDERTFRSIQRLIFYFVLSFALSIYLISYIDPNLKSVIDELSYGLEASGVIMFVYSVIFGVLILTSLLVKSIDRLGFGKLKTFLQILIIVIIYFGVSWLISFLKDQEWSKDVGLLLLGPINLLIAKMLFAKPKKEEYLIEW